MRKIIIAGLVLLTGLGVVLGVVPRPTAGPVGATTASAAARASVMAAIAADSDSAIQVGLGGVSCASAKFCVADGYQAKQVGRPAPLAMIWNGARWRTTATPLPKGWSAGELNSVSCLSATYCVAYGSVTTSNDWSRLAETWRGRAWTASVLPKPTTAAVGAVNFGYMVSCGAVGHCVALVGYRGIETLTGTKWTVRLVPLPKGYTSGSVAGVSCVSATSCVIVGGYGHGKGWSEFFERWNGSRFTMMKVSSAEPAAKRFIINSVSCAAAKSCVALGSIPGSSAVFSLTPLAEVWNGKSWSVRTVTGSKGSDSAMPAGVSCMSTARCVAVGRTFENGDESVDHALALTYNGRSWLTAGVPALPHGDTSALEAVSCPSATYCVAVGQEGSSAGTPNARVALTGFWNGKTWKLVSVS